MRVGIVGASGYTGLELVKLIVAHPEFKLTYLATTTGDTLVETLHPSLFDVVTMTVEKASVDAVKNICDLVFLALPHKASMGFAKELWDNDIKVVDLSADYRLMQDTYEKHYCEHEDSEHANDGVYGLPEYYREDIKNAKLVASPGCYPTATLLGILPFMPYIDTNAPLFVDAKSGVSGAGKSCTETTHFVNINENIFAYNPLKHRHAPEIMEKITDIHGVSPKVHFVPHLVPMTRGELVSIYATLKSDIDPLEVLKSHYENEPFIRIRENPVTTKNVSGTHFCDIFAMRDGNALFVSSSIDNILRGASSQAVAAANLMCGFAESLGLPIIAYVP
jgi:N-acetyl-gamma-glutamyl-phosphate reductase